VGVEIELPVLELPVPTLPVLVVPVPTPLRLLPEFRPPGAVKFVFGASEPTAGFLLGPFWKLGRLVVVGAKPVAPLSAAPAMVEPGIVEPGIVEPGIVEPGTIALDAVEPGTPAPGVL